MQDFERVAVLGAGVIGASWTTLFLAAGLQVDVYDQAPDTEKNVRKYRDIRKKPCILIQNSLSVHIN